MGNWINTSAALVGLLACLSLLSACGGPPPSSGNSESSAASGIPELTKEVIDERINDARVYDVLPENGTGNSIPWSFDEDEPKEIVVVDQQIDGNRATIILDIKTQSAPYANNLRYLHGKIKTEWVLETGWVLRRWMIESTENISMVYRDLPKATPTPPEIPGRPPEPTSR